MANILVVQFIFILLAFAAFQFQFHKCFWQFNDITFVKSYNNRIEFEELIETKKKECNINCSVIKSNHSIKPRIDGGTNVEEPTQWPFFATLSRPEGPICGGAILSDKLVLTTGSCYIKVTEKDKYSIFTITNTTFRFFGAPGIVIGGSRVCLSKFYQIRPSINGAYRSKRDFAVVEVKSSLLDRNDTINEAIKIRSDSTKMILEEDAACYIVSHTKNGEGVVRMVSARVKILKCYLQDEGQFCFEGSDNTVLTCDNDSGSTIVCFEQKTNSYVLVGIVSTVLQYCNPNMTSKGVYNVATNISFIYDEYNECVDEFNKSNQ